MALSVALVAARLAWAEAPAVMADPARGSDTCPGEGITAKVFMGQRQRLGRSLGDMMEQWGGVPKWREMVLEAFEVPLMMTPETRQIAIDEFQNKWTLKCYKRVGG